MKKNTHLLIFTALLVFVSFGRLKSQNTCPTWEWATQMQKSNNPGKILKATGDDHGNFYVVGWFTGSLTLGTTTIATPSASFFVAKFDSNKVWAWSVKFELSTPQYYATHHLFSKGLNLQYHPAGKLVVTGLLSDSASFDSLSLTNSSQQNNLFVAQLNTNTLQWEWAQKAEGIFNYVNNYNTGNRLIYDSAGNVCLSGYVYNSPPQGNLIFGSDTLEVNTNYMAFIAKLNPQGNWQWARKLSFARSYGTQITTYPNGNVMVAGSFTGTINFANQQATAVNQDIFLVTYSPAGQPLNLKTVAGAWLGHLALDGQQNLYIIGTSGDTLIFGNDTLNAPGYFIAKFNSSGNPQWAKPFGAGLGWYNSPLMAITSPNGKTTMTDLQHGLAYFGDDTLQPNLGPYVAAIDSAGNWLGAGQARITSRPITPYESLQHAITEDLQGNLFIMGTLFDDYQFGLHHLSNPLDYAAKISYQPNIALQFDADTLHYFCGDSLEIDLKSNSAAQLYYNWAPTTGLNDSTIRNPTSKHRGVIKYVVDAHSSNGCTVRDSVIVIRDTSVWFGRGIHFKPILGARVFCSDSITISTINTFASYLWSTGDTTATISPTKPGTYILTAYDGDGCFSHDSITIHPLVAINTASPLLCPNDSVVLNVNATDLDSLRWFNGSNTAQQTVTQAGNYWVTAYKQNCYYTDTITVVDFTDTANAQFSYTNMGLKEVQFKPVSIGIATGFWDFGDGNTASGINAQHSYANYGSYYVCYHVTDVCGYTAQVCDSITVAPVGLNEWNKSDGFSLYPNPSSGDLFLQADEPFTGTLNLYNSSGMLVYQKHLPRKRQWHLNLSHLPNGFYVAQIGNQRFRWVRD